MQSPPNASPPPAPLFAEPTPLGLIGLAVGCAGLLPIAFGYATPGALKTAAMFCLLFGAGGQFLAGMMNFANKNQLGGTIFTAFSFNWLMNWWALDALSQGIIPDERVILAVDVLYLVIFVPVTYAFGFYSKLLFAFLVDIDLLYVARIAKGLTHTSALNLPIAFFTAALAFISLWIAIGMLVNPVAGRQVVPFPGPMYAPKAAPNVSGS